MFSCRNRAPVVSVGMVGGSVLAAVSCELSERVALCLQVWVLVLLEKLA